MIVLEIIIILNISKQFFFKVLYELLIFKFKYTKNLTIIKLAILKKKKLK